MKPLNIVLLVTLLFSGSPSIVRAQNSTPPVSATSQPLAVKEQRCFELLRRYVFYSMLLSITVNSMEATAEAARAHAQRVGAIKGLITKEGCTSDELSDQINSEIEAEVRAQLNKR